MKNRGSIEATKICMIVGWAGMISVIQYLLVLMLLMVFYPGGYRFSEFSISSLGYHFSRANSAINYIGHDIGLISDVLLLIGLYPMSILLTNHLRKYRSSHTFAWIGMILIMISLVGVILGHIYSGDVFRPQHNFFSDVFSPPYMLSVVFYSISFMLDKEYNKGYAFMGMVVAALTVFYLYVEKNAITQKLAIFSVFIWWFFQCFNMMRYYSKKKIKRMQPNPAST